MKFSYTNPPLYWFLIWLVFTCVSALVLIGWLSADKPLVNENNELCTESIVTNTLVECLSPKEQVLQDHLEFTKIIKYGHSWIIVEYDGVFIDIIHDPDCEKCKKKDDQNACKINFNNSTQYD